MILIRGIVGRWNAQIDLTLWWWA